MSDEIIKYERVIAYIDGYNLYFGMKDSGFKRYLWLNSLALVQNLLKPNQKLIKVKYFTTLVTNDINKRQRQKTYLGALQTVNDIQIFYGKFQKEKTHCNACGNDTASDCEKTTDVAIAVEIIKDYYEGTCDMAMLISGDTDLLPPIKFINEETQNRVFVAFPPNRINDEVRKFAKGDIVIGRKNLSKSQFPNEVTNANGEVFTKPNTWV